MRIIVLPRAEEDIAECAIFISKDNVDAAIRFLDQTRETFDFLAKHPAAGGDHQFSSNLLKGTKVWSIKGFENWLVFYQIREGEVLIIRVLHGAREINKLH